MSTAQNRSSRSTETTQLQPLTLGAILEIAFVVVGTLCAFAQGPYGYYNWGWSKEQASIHVVIAALAVLAVWALIRFVRNNSERKPQATKIDPTATPGYDRKPGAPLYTGPKFGDE